MKARQHITGILLAGGKSSRMGTDKGFVLWKGIPFIQHIIAAIKPLVNDILIVSDHTAYDALGFSRICDVFPSAGPISGLYSGLHHSKTALNIVLSCDVPLVTTELLEMLINNYRDENDALLFEGTGTLMPLVALYDKKCEEVCLGLLENNERRLMQLIKKINVRTIPLNSSQELLVSNINCLEDLKEIENEYSH